MSKDKLILGIDPGTATTGFGVITCGQPQAMVDYGVISTPKTDKAEKRLEVIFEAVAALLHKYQPELVAIEKLFFQRNITTAMSVSEARGVVLLAAAKAGVRVIEVTPLQTKLAITGYGKADKKQVQTMVQKLLHLDKLPKPDDAADALAIALACDSKMMKL